MRRLLIALLLGSLAAPAGWGAPVATPPALTAEDLGPFLDGRVPPALALGDLAGAVVSVVAGGKTLISRGYGMADMAAGRPVSADETLFHIGSISKLLIWTASMQLVQDGKLDLDRDINAYLDFRVEGLAGAPITMRQLMTHTAGFEETLRDMFNIVPPGPGQGLGWYVKTHIPPVRTRPGSVPAYSNYGAMLAAYIVERISGKPYAEVIGERIMAPLGMAHTSIVQPLPAGLELSEGYRAASAGARPREYIWVAPVGAISSTGDDMARLMLGYLTPGTLMSTATQALMWARQPTVDPRISGIALGFVEERRNGLRVIWHNGGTEYFSSNLKMLPDLGVGVFISVNSAGKGGAARQLVNGVWQDFMDRYYPAPVPVGHAIASARHDAMELAGTWLASRRREHGVWRLINLLNNETVTAAADGTITLDDVVGPSGAARHWVEIDRDIWQNEIGDRLAVRRGTDGKPALFGREPVAGAESSERPPADEDGAAGLVAAGAILVLVVLLLLMPMRALARRIYRGVAAAGAWRSALKLGLLVVPLCVVGLLVVMVASLDGHTEYLTTPVATPWLRALRIAGYAVILAALVAVVEAVRWWLPAGQGGVWWRRVEAVLLAGASLVLAYGVAAFGVLDGGYDF